MRRFAAGQTVRVFAGAATSGRRPTVLVCDDEEPLRRLVRAALEGSECSVLEARDGNEALELARSTRPDLILLDMIMPGRSGLEVLEELRHDPGLAGITVVFLTARAQVTDREAAAVGGADHFLPKPFSIVELTSLVERLLEGRHTTSHADEDQ